MLRSADVGVSQAAEPDPATVGKPLTYTLMVSNAGSSSASSVLLTGTLANGATFVPVQPSQGSPCRTPTPGQAGGRLTCTLGSIAAGGSATVQVVVRPTAPGALTNTLSVRQAERDANPANNTASPTAIVGP